MTVQEIMATLRRHLPAVVMVVIVGFGVGYTVRHRPTAYVESATVLLAAPTSPSNPNPYATVTDSLITTAGITTIELTSPREREQIRAAGGTAAFDVQLVNLYNLEYPNYGYPLISLSATSASQSATSRTFALAARAIRDDLQRLQASARVPRVDRIVAHVVGDTGALPDHGSSKRVLAGLLVLMIVAAFSVATFLDRHPVRLRRRGRPPRSAFGELPS